MDKVTSFQSVTVEDVPDGRTLLDVPRADFGGYFSGFRS
jgi:hypothetical protein